jgi:hypothetical protein
MNFSWYKLNEYGIYENISSQIEKLPKMGQFESNRENQFHIIKYKQQ